MTIEMTRLREQIFQAIRAWTSATIAEAEAATKTITVLVDQQWPHPSCAGRAITPEMVNAAWSKGKDLRMTGLPTDFRQVLEAAVRVHQSGWLPVDTAPEDQHVILMTTGGHVGEALMLRDEDTGQQKWTWALGPVHANHTPLGWQPMPLPPPPAEGE